VRAQMPQLHIIWAPRHIERIGELEELLKTNGLAFKRISEMRKLAESFSKDTPYVLWDSMGDLLDAYRQADVAVVGGSFVPKGGQNPIEPAALRLPILFGPSMDNFEGVADALVRSGGAKSVSADELDGQLTALLKDPQAREDMGERAHQAVLDQQGATDRTLQLLKELAGA
jgi:3-deoxy-D-manno-octulosonic-acid transferase